MLHRLLFTIILFASLWVCAKIGKDRGPVERSRMEKLSTPPLARWSPYAVKLATLGHRGLYDDFNTIWLVQLLADRQLKTAVTGDQVHAAIMPVLRHQPKIEALYLFACFIISMDFDRSDYCEEISMLGLKAFPDSWRIPMIQGFTSGFKTGEKGKAAAYYALAATRPQSPPYVKRLAQKLANSAESDPEDLNATLEMFKEIPGGTKLLEMMRPTLSAQLPAPLEEPKIGPAPEPSSATPVPSSTPEPETSMPPEESHPPEETKL